MSNDSILTLGNEHFEVIIYDNYITLVNKKSQSYSNMPVTETTSATTTTTINAINKTITQETSVATISTTTSIATTSTTINASYSILQNAFAILKNTSIYTIMNEYNNAYANAYANCTPSLYNNTYARLFNSMPFGPNTFYNITKPRGITMNETLGKNGYVAFDYYILLANTKQASATVTINPSTNYISAVFYNLFEGQNVTTLINNYNSAKSIGNACGIYMP